MKSDLVDLTLHLHHETALAVQVSDNGDRKRAVWLPKSQIEIDRAIVNRGDMYVVVTLPEWLATREGLV